MRPDRPVRAARPSGERGVGGRAFVDLGGVENRHRERRVAGPQPDLRAGEADPLSTAGDEALRYLCAAGPGRREELPAPEPAPAPPVTQNVARETPEPGPGAGLPRRAMLICGSVLPLVALGFWSSRNRGPEKSEGARRTEAVQEEARSLPYPIVGSWTWTHPDPLGSHDIELTVGEDLTVVSTTIRRDAGKVTQTFSWTAPDTVAFNDDQIDATRIGERFVVEVDQPLGVGRHSRSRPMDEASLPASIRSSCPRARRYAPPTACSTSGRRGSRSRTSAA